MPEPDDTTPIVNAGDVVRIPTWELLRDINRQLQSIDEKLDTKANIADVQTMATRQAADLQAIANKQIDITARLAALELIRKHEQTTDEDRRLTKERIWNVSLGIALILVTLISVLGIHL